MEYIPISEETKSLVSRFMVEHWYTTTMVLRGEVYDMTLAEGVIALSENEVAGLITYMFYDSTCEITSLDSLLPAQGIGTRLLEMAIAAAKARKCRRVILITTNDNIHAIRFYQMRGFDMARLYHNALDASRKLKPEIPLVGEHGIPLRHEIEFEMLL